MRLTIKLALVAAVVGILAAGLLPPVFARGQLDGYARDAAQKASTVFMGEGEAAAQQIAAQAVATHPGVHLVSVSVSGQDNTVSVTVSEDVHTIFRSFHLQSTEYSSFGQ